MGGNLLINVGADGTGRIPDHQHQPLRELGAWLDMFGLTHLGQCLGGDVVGLRQNTECGAPVVASQLTSCTLRAGLRR